MSRSPEPSPSRGRTGRAPSPTRRGSSVSRSPSPERRSPSPERRRRSPSPERRQSPERDGAESPTRRRRSPSPERRQRSLSPDGNGKLTAEERRARARAYDAQRHQTRDTKHKKPLQPLPSVFARAFRREGEAALSVLAREHRLTLQTVRLLQSHWVYGLQMAAEAKFMLEKQPVLSVTEEDRTRYDRGEDQPRLRRIAAEVRDEMAAMGMSSFAEYLEGVAALATHGTPRDASGFLFHVYARTEPHMLTQAEMHELLLSHSRAGEGAADAYRQYLYTWAKKHHKQRCDADGLLSEEQFRALLDEFPQIEDRLQVVVADAARLLAHRDREEALEEAKLERDVPISYILRPQVPH